LSAHHFDERRSELNGIPVGSCALQGVMILHRSMVAALAASFKTMPVYTTDVHLSYLPLAHIFERLVLVYGLFAGSRLGFYQGVRSPIRAKQLHCESAHSLNLGATGRQEAGRRHYGSKAHNLCWGASCVPSHL